MILLLLSLFFPFPLPVGRECDNTRIVLPSECLNAWDLHGLLNHSKA